MSYKVEQLTSWPEPMIRDLQAHAVRTDRSLSNIAQTAWIAAHRKVAKLDRAALQQLVATTGRTKKCKQSLFFPVEMARAIEAEATRVESDFSLPLQAAYVLAEAKLAALPEATGFVVED